MTFPSAALKLEVDGDRLFGPADSVAVRPIGRRTVGTSVDELELLDRHMALLADGDRSAIRPLFRSLWPAIHGYCERALGIGADADDAAQQAMEKVFREAPRYDRTRRALPWALAIALWECRTLRRRNQRTRATLGADLSDVADPTMSPEDAAIQAQLVAEARTLFARLSASDRQVLEETFSAEVEQRSLVSGPTLRKRRERALRRLRNAWRQFYGP